MDAYLIVGGLSPSSELRASSWSTPDIPAWSSRIVGGLIGKALLLEGLSKWLSKAQISSESGLEMDDLDLCEAEMSGMGCYHILTQSSILLSGLLD